MTHRLGIAHYQRTHDGYRDKESTARLGRLVYGLDDGEGEVDRGGGLEED